MSVHYLQNTSAAPATLTQCSSIHLSPRQIEVLRLLGEGLSNKRIARALGISDHTVKQHIQCVMEELGAVSRLQAVIYAYRRGILALDSGAAAPAGAAFGLAVGAGRGPLLVSGGND